MELDLAEMGAVGTGIVTDVTDCPEVQPGEGQVITATFRHPPSTDVLDVWFEDCEERSRLRPSDGLSRSDKDRGLASAADSGPESATSPTITDRSGAGGDLAGRLGSTAE